MDRAQIEARLTAARIGDGPTLRPSVTLRPANDDLAIAATMAVPSDAPPPAMPRISIDLSSSARKDSLARARDLEVRGVIGEGGMGRVLLARQHSLSRDVAVKTTKHGAGRAARGAILAEGAIAGRLEHPAIVPVHALGADESGEPVLVMKRIEGVGWDVLLRDPKHDGWAGSESTPDDRLLGHLEILASVCNAIHFAHSRGIVHRDIKPENVLIGRYGDVYLADWGVAGTIGERRAPLCGTPGYMAPEMVTGGLIDARTDVYLLGATLHEVLTGRLRHAGTTALEALALAERSLPFEYDAAVPRELADLANRACAADPERRPATAEAFRGELSTYLRHRDARALADQAMQRVRELEPLLALDAPDAAERQRIDRLLAEARFGLEQALAQWSDNASAREAASRLEAIVVARAERAAALEREAQERDPRLQGTARTVGIVLLALLVGSIALFVILRGGERSRVLLASYPVGVGVLVAAGAFVLRKQMFGSAFNRKLLACLMVAIGLLIAGRVTGLVAELPMAAQFTRDSFAISGASAVAAVAYLRWLGGISLAYLASGILCTFLPEHAGIVFSAVSALAIVIAAVGSWRLRGRSAM
jgi:hypothetical protein